MCFNLSLRTFTLSNITDLVFSTLRIDFSGKITNKYDPRDKI